MNMNIKVIVYCVTVICSQIGVVLMKSGTISTTIIANSGDRIIENFLPTSGEITKSSNIFIPPTNNHIVEEPIIEPQSEYVTQQPISHIILTPYILNPLLMDSLKTLVNQKNEEQVIQYKDSPVINNYQNNNENPNSYNIVNNNGNQQAHNNLLYLNNYKDNSNNYQQHSYPTTGSYKINEVNNFETEDHKPNNEKRETLNKYLLFPNFNKDNKLKNEYDTTGYNIQLTNYANDNDEKAQMIEFFKKMQKENEAKMVQLLNEYRNYLLKNEENEVKKKTKEKDYSSGKLSTEKEDEIYVTAPDYDLDDYEEYIDEDDDEPEDHEDEDNNIEEIEHETPNYHIKPGDYKHHTGKKKLEKEKTLSDKKKEHISYKQRNTNKKSNSTARNHTVHHINIAEDDYVIVDDHEETPATHLHNSSSFSSHVGDDDNKNRTQQDLPKNTSQHVNSTNATTIDAGHQIENKTENDKIHEHKANTTEKSDNKKGHKKLVCITDCAIINGQYYTYRNSKLNNTAELKPITPTPPHPKKTIPYHIFPSRRKIKGTSNFPVHNIRLPVVTKLDNVSYKEWTPHDLPVFKTSIQISNKKLRKFKKRDINSVKNSLYKYFIKFL